jgi:hypothetical protein
MIQNPTIVQHIKSQNPSLQLTPHEDGKHWLLLKDFSYELYSRGSGAKICVPRDYVTDLASTPRLIWSVFPPWERYGKAAIIHDYLYYTGMCSRKHADMIMREIMINSNVDIVSRTLIYMALRLCGWMFYKKSTTISLQYDTTKFTKPTDDPLLSDNTGEMFRTIRRIVFFLAGWGAFIYLFWKLLCLYLCSAP